MPSNYLHPRSRIKQSDVDEALTEYAARHDRTVGKAPKNIGYKL